MDTRPWQIRLLSRKFKRAVDCHLRWLADVAEHEASSRLSKDDAGSKSQRSLAGKPLFRKGGRWLVMNLERMKQQIKQRDPRSQSAKSRKVRCKQDLLYMSK